MRIFLFTIFVFLPAILFAGEDPVIFEESGKQGLKDEKGQVLIPPMFEKVGWANGASSVVDGVIGYRENQKWGLIRIDNKKITSPQYTSLVPIDDDRILAVRPNNSYRFTPSGIINSRGQVVISFSYLTIEPAGDHYIVSTYASDRVKFGVIDGHEEFLLNMRFQQIEYINNSRFAVLDDSGKWALFNEGGMPLTSFSFDRIGAFQGRYAGAYQRRAMGLIDTGGAWVVQPSYASIEVQGDVVKASHFPDWDILTEENHKLHSVAFDSVLPWKKEHWKVVANGHEWIVDQSFNAVTPDTYNHIARLGERLLIFASENKFGVISSAGNVLIPPRYDSISSVNGRIYAKANSGVERGWTIFDMAGKALTELNYQDLGAEQASGLIPVKRNLKWGMLDREGAEVIACTFDAIGASVPGKIVVVFKGKSGLINERGEWLLSPADGKITLIDGQYYLLQNNGVTYLKHIQKGTIYFTSNPLEVKDGYLIETRGKNSFWKINLSGQILNTTDQTEYEEIRFEREGFIAIRMNGRYGFIDRQDRLRIANRYDDVTDFQEGLAGFRLLNKWGFLNKQEGIVIQPRFDKVSGFRNGLCIVETGGLKGVIDTNGNWVIKPEYGDVELLENGRYKIVKAGKTGLLDEEGHIIVSPKYDELNDLDGGQVIVRRQKKYGLVSREGIDLIPTVYDYLIFDPYNNCYLGMKKSGIETIPLR